MALYVDNASKLLHVVRNPDQHNCFYFLDDTNYKFTYKSNYSGLMAQKSKYSKSKLREKQGYFDILGQMKGSRLTHQDLFDLILNNTTLEECQSVWRGYMPKNLDSPLKKHSLYSLAMLMFEQEINFGQKNFQRFTHFNSSSGARPRDLLMGYIAYVFDNGNTNCLSDFKNTFGILLPPIKNKIMMENYFYPLKKDTAAIALMERDIAKEFVEIARQAPKNPNFS